MLSIGSTIAFPEDIDWKKGRLERLIPYIGTYKYEQILDDPDVMQALSRLARDQIKIIEANLEVRSPINFEDGNLVLQGNRAHQGMTELAIVEIKIYDGTVRAALRHDGKVFLYADDSEFRYIPWGVRRFVSHGEAFEVLPENVTWVH
jgi:hypothetical protein